MNVYCVYWVPKGIGDCEKEYDYVLADSQKQAMNNPRFKYVFVIEVRGVYGKEKEDALNNHWCINDENREQIY